jgi:Ca-activated chloride channel family protein
VAGRIDRPRRGDLTSRLTSADGGEVAVERQTVGAEQASRRAVAALFGARRVLELELAGSSGIGLEKRLRQLGYDPDRVFGRTLGSPEETFIYAENRRAQATDTVKDLLVQEALRYGIACSETAFVATRSEAGAKVAGTVAVANALPQGWSPDFLMARVASFGTPTGTARLMQTFAPAPMSAMPSAPPPYPDAGYGAPMPSAPPPGSSGGASDLGSFARGTLDAAVRRLRPRLSRPTPPAAGAPGNPTMSPAGPGQTSGRFPALFSGAPTFAGHEAVLFDSTTSPGRLPEGGTLSRLAVRFLDGSPTGSIDPGLTLLLFVDDLTAPRARVRLADLLRQGGERPLNVRRQPGQIVRLVLQDANGAWVSSAPHLEVSLG